MRLRVDAEAGEAFALIRFTGMHSNLVLKLPASQGDKALLTKKPFFACAGFKHWGQGARGVEASWERRRTGE